MVREIIGERGGIVDYTFVIYTNAWWSKLKELRWGRK
jgi:hypothetical protein